MARVLVIGGTGFIGRPAVRQLLDHGHAVLIVHRGRTATEVARGAHAVQGDRSDVVFLRGVVSQFRPDVTVDLISYCEAHMQAVLSALDGVTSRLVALSSADVYRNYDGLRRRSSAPPDPGPLTEDAPVRDRWYPYRDAKISGEPWLADYEKLAVEQAVSTAREVEGTVLRLGKVFGPRDGQRHLEGYLDRVLESARVIQLEPGQASWRWTRAFVEDVAHAIVLVVGDPRAVGRTYNVGEANAVPERDWFMAVAAAAGVVVSVEETETDLVPAQYRTGFDWRYSLETATDRVRTELRYHEIVGWSKGVERMVGAAMTKRSREPRPKQP